LFDIGDKVVYPMHGAGVIEGIEEKEILGQRKKYFVMRMPIGDMKVMVPMENVDHIGLRQVVGNEAVNRVMNILGERDTELQTNWNQRYRANMDKMKSGDIYELADVVRNLMIRDRSKGLSTGERKMLDQAKQILISELALVKDMESKDVFTMLDGLVKKKDASL
jgi:CarD family transcriptional regulator